MSEKLTRRTFMGRTAGAVMVGGMMASGRIWGANERVGVCVVGLNGRGGSHIKEFGNKPDSDIVAMCDVDGNVLKGRIRNYKKEHDLAPAQYSDIREALADKQVDAISIATPNHWHALGAIWGIQAGKDVYVEKPLSHNVHEGRVLVDLEAKSKQIVQHGTQSRSDATWMRDIKLMQDGFIGKVHMAKGFTYKTGNRHSIGHTEYQDPPKHLDWKLWQGPSQDQKYCKNYVHYNWHWFWEYGCGETGNQGVHQMDLAVWGMNKGLPVSVNSAGGRYHWKDQGETPNTQVSTYTYAGGETMVFEIRNYGSYPEAGSLTTGNTYWAADGYYVQGKGFFSMDREPIPVPDDEAWPKTDGAFQNFINACKSRKKSDINGTALDGHMSSAHCHIANAAYRTGKTLTFDPKTERFTGDYAKEANKMITREYRDGFEV